MSSSYILDISPFSEVSLSSIFSHLVKIYITLVLSRVGSGDGWGGGSDGGEMETTVLEQ